MNRNIWVFNNGFAGTFDPFIKEVGRMHDELVPYGAASVVARIVSALAAVAHDIKIYRTASTSKMQELESAIIQARRKMVSKQIGNLEMYHLDLIQILFDRLRDCDDPLQKEKMLATINTTIRLLEDNLKEMANELKGRL